MTSAINMRHSTHAIPVLANKNNRKQTSNIQQTTGSPTLSYDRSNASDQFLRTQLNIQQYNQPNPGIGREYMQKALWHNSQYFAIYNGLQKPNPANLSRIAEGMMDLKKADQYALKFMKSSETVTVRDKGNLEFIPKMKPQHGLILYPGARVDPKAYAPIAHKLAKRNIFVVIPTMPFHIPVFAPKKAAEILDKYPDIKWNIGGHSDGGLAASDFANSNTDKIGKVVYLGSFPNPFKKAKKCDQKHLFITATNDNVMNKGMYKRSTGQFNDSDRAQFQVIEGGNHAQFGSYGAQDGDGNPGISKQQQHQEIIDHITNFLNS